MLRLTFSLPFKGNQLSVSKDSKARCVGIRWRERELIDDFTIWLTWSGMARSSEQTRMGRGGLKTQKQKTEIDPVLERSQRPLLRRTLDLR